MEVEIPYKFTARDYQIAFLKETESAINNESDKRFFYQVWHRRSGKDKTNIADVVPRRLIKSPCQVKYVYPTSVMGRTHLWEAIGKDGLRFIDHLPKQLYVDKPNDTRMLIKTRNATNTPSLFQVVGANHPDTLRGGNPVLFIFSEWAEHDPYTWDVVEPILRENGGIAIFNTTPKGNNHARALYEYAKDNPSWYTQILTVNDTKVFTDQEMREIKDDVFKRFDASGRSQEEALTYIEQEYYCSFETPVLGSYYGHLIRKAEKEDRICNVPYEERLPVITVWDLGIDDSNSIWFIQIAGQEIRFIDYYESSGEGIPYYIKYLQDKKYIYGDHYAPHDIKVREMSTGMSRWDTAKKLGITFNIAKKLGLDDGIDAVRGIFNRFWFDKNKCHRGIQALKNYKKDWDEKNMVFRKRPLHNWASHAADALRTFATGYRKPFIMRQAYGGVKKYYTNFPV